MPKAARYTHGHHDSVLRSHRWRTAENSAAYLLGELSAGQELLDVGCGPGTITCDLAARVSPGRTIGIDVSKEVLVGASAAAKERGVAVEFEQGDIYALRFPDASFDVVHAHQVLQHLGDPVAALREMRRVCRPGGVIAVRDSDYEAFTWFPAEPAMDRWLSLYRDVARGNNAEPDAGRKLLHWAQAAGCTDVRPSASVWCYATPEDRAWWGGLWAERITSSALGEQMVARNLATKADLGEMAAAWSRWSQAADGWFAVLHGEILITV